jgi:hypothetical protein
VGGVVGDPLLEQLAEGQPCRRLGARDGVAGPDDLEDPLPVVDRRRARLVSERSSRRENDFERWRSTPFSSCSRQRTL